MKLQELFPLQFCINLDERTDRWELVSKEFEKMNVNPTRFSAIANPKNPAQGCLKSHLAVLKEAQKLKQNVFIFEDDIMLLGEDYNEIIEKSLDELEQVNWCMFYLNANILRPVYQVNEHLGRLSHAQSTDSYGIHKDFLDTLVPFLESQNYFIDVLYSEFVVPKFPCYISIPMAMIQRPDYSDIEHQIVDYSYTVDRFNQNLVRKE